MIAPGFNVKSPTGKVHSLVHRGNNRYLLCNSWFNIAVEGWPDWKQTYNEVTCRNCLKLRKEANHFWKIRYWQTFAMTGTRYVVAPNRTEAVLLFGRNMPKDCTGPNVEVFQVSAEDMLKEKMIL